MSDTLPRFSPFGYGQHNPKKGMVRVVLAHYPSGDRYVTADMPAAPDIGDHIDFDAVDELLPCIVTQRRWILDRESEHWYLECSVK